MEILNNQNEINIVMKDYFNIVGIFITTIVIIYDFFIIKFIEVFTTKPEKRTSYRKAIIL